MIYFDALVEIARQIIGIDIEDLTKAEKNIAFVLEGECKIIRFNKEKNIYEIVYYQKKSFIYKGK